MRGVRRRFSWIIGAWLLCQLSTMVLVPVSLCASGTAIEESCTCAHADGTECPMHHTKKPARPALSRSTGAPASCSCRSTTDGPTATLASLFSPAAVLTPATATAATAIAARSGTIADAVLLNASIHPDPHPPRA
jgi:hypothetical protein